MMTFWEWVTLLGFITGIVGVWMTGHGYFNNKSIKQIAADNKNLLEKMNKTIEYLGNLIVADGEKTREILREIRAKL